MLADGLLTRFPHPDYALAVHDDARLPSGIIGYHSGPILTNADAVTIKIYGRGGHGARPDATVDPIVIAARTVLSLQTIVSRENSPFDPAVVTVGSIHGGTKNNIIPDEVQLQLTVRSFTEPVRKHLLSAIERITKAEALAAGAPREPTFEYGPPAQALVNDSALTRRVAGALLKALGPARVKDTPPEMASEDFAEFQLAGIPTLMMRVGAVQPAKYDAAMKSGTPLPSLHSSQFAPDREPTIKSAMLAEVLALRELMPAGRAADRGVNENNSFHIGQLPYASHAFPAASRTVARRGTGRPRLSVIRASGQQRQAGAARAGARLDRHGRCAP
jgi:amidohydrolase